MPKHDLLVFLCVDGLGLIVVNIEEDRDLVGRTKIQNGHRCRVSWLS